MGLFYGRLQLLEFLIVPFLTLVYLTLSYLTFPFLFKFIVVLVFAYFYNVVDQVTLKNVLKSIITLAIKIFFREIGHCGTHKVPSTGPVIFVCAPHANQFVDPLLVMHVIPRDVGFLCAAKSMRRKWVGSMARALNAIGVERPQDLAKGGVGKITTKGSKVTGTGTSFDQVLKPGWSIVIQGESYQVAQVDSATELTLSASLPSDLDKPTSYQFAPKVDQSAVFESVWSSLKDGKCVGIFPEGGSHDRTDFLPLKAGVTMMALGAIAKYGIDVKIVPVGLNYFSGHRFRSRAFIEIGDPIPITSELVDKYREGGVAKREACTTLLDNIQRALRTVTVVAPNSETLELLWAVRRLYVPDGKKFPMETQLELTRRFEEVYEKLNSDERVQPTIQRVIQYNQQLQALGLRDHQVRSATLTNADAVKRLCLLVAALMTMAVFALPGFILNFPIFAVARFISRQKAVEALKASSVKIEGKDVLATWKLMVSMAMMPFVFVVYPILAAVVGHLKGWGAINTWAYFAILQIFMMYASVRFSETGIQIARQIKPLFVSVLKKQTGVAILLERQDLRRKIREMVDSLGPELFGSSFHASRVVSEFDDVDEATKPASKPSKSNEEDKHIDDSEEYDIVEGASDDGSNPNVRRFGSISL